MSPTDYTATSHWRCQNCSCVTSVIENLGPYSARIWDYPNYRLSKHIMTINCIHVTAHRAHCLFPDDCSLRMQFCERPRYQHATDYLFFTKICGQTKHDLCVRVCSTSTAVAPGDEIIPMSSTKIDMKSHSSSAFGQVWSRTWQSDSLTTS